jgi:N-acetylglucosaminyldiphosphoundecaprenol N-acetyl-beta-D-mannosaminyltransferase
MSAPALAEPPTAATALRTRRLLGLPVAVTDYTGAMEAMDAMVLARERGYVVVAPVHALIVARDDPEMRAAMTDATFTVPDGMPLVWLLRGLGERLEDRVYGPTLMDRYCGRCADRGHRVWLYGGTDDGAREELAAALRARHPGLRVVGGFSPPFRALSGEEEDEVVARIDADRPDVVWVGTGQPKQEKWMARMRPRLEAPVLCGVGAAFDFHAGRVPQAPRWMQDRGLEWLYRLGQEPRRLGPRYLRTNPRFAVAALRQLARERRRRSPAAHGTLPADS